MVKRNIRALPRYVTYNVGDASPERLRDDFRRMIRDEEPDVIGLQEVGDRGSLIRDVSRASGYRIVCVGSQPASNHVAFLVAPGVEIARTKLHRLSGPKFVGRNTAGSRRTGIAGSKYVLVAVVKIRGRRRRVGVTHLVPSAERRGNVATRALHGVQTAHLAGVFRFGRRKSVFMGDMNAQPGSPLLRLLRVVGRVYGVPSHGRRSIDLFVTSRTLRATVKALHGFSSDHRPVLLREVNKKEK